MEAIVRPYLLFGALGVVSDSTYAYLRPHSLCVLAWSSHVVSDRELEHNRARMNFQKELCGFAISLRENGMFGCRRRGLSFQHQKDDGRWVGVARRERKSCAKMEADWKKDSGY